MKKITATMNQLRQVTIPAAVRRVVGLEPGDKVTFTIEGGEVRLTPAVLTLESAYGSVKPSRRPEDFEKLSRITKEAKTQRTLTKMKKA